MSEQTPHSTEPSEDSYTIDGKSVSKEEWLVSFRADMKRVLTATDEEIAAEIAASPDLQRRVQEIRERSKGRPGESRILPVRRKPR